MAQIAFLSPHHKFSGIDLREKALGGISGNTIMLAEALEMRGHTVTVHNAVEHPVIFNDVKYLPFNCDTRIVADLAISNNSARPFQNVKARKKVVWQRNRTNWFRAFKRKEIWELLRNRPNLVCLSPNSARNTSKTLPYCSQTVIQLGIGDIFLNAQPKSSAPEKPQALFASRPYRRFDWLLDTWKNHVLPAVPDALLHVCTPKLSDTNAENKELRKFNVIHHGPLPRTGVAELMQKCRVLLCPGHRDEAGCSVALQSIASGLPIITSGYGCLKDQVQHGITGFIETDPVAFAKQTITCLQNDSLWMELHRNSLKSEWKKDWNSVAIEWEQAFLEDS